MSPKKSSKVTHVTEATKVTPEVNETATPAIAVVNPVPAQVSAPPGTWVKPDKIGNKGRRPKNGLTLVAPELAAELLKNATAIRQELGPKAVDPAQLASALGTAVSWDGVEAKAETFHTYSRAQRSAAWDEAVTLMVGLMPGVRFALKRDATFADRFPKVAKAFAPTRRSKKSAAGGAEAEAPATSETPAVETQAAKPATTA
jgi:hypothetical protein